MSGDFIEQLVARVEAWSPGFAAGLRGAEEAEIAAFEQALGRPIPGELRAFLARMGHDHNGLIGYSDALSFDVAAYTEFAASEVHAPPAHFTVAAVPGPDYLAIYFDHRAARQLCPLVRLTVVEGMSVAIPEHSSFLDMLVGFAFTTKRLPDFAYELHLRSPGLRPARFPDSPPGTWVPRLAWIAGQLGFVEIGGSGPWWRCFEREDAALSIFEAPSFTPDVRVAARERKVLAQVSELLADNLELVAHPGSLRQPD